MATYVLALECFNGKIRIATISSTIGAYLPDPTPVQAANAWRCATNPYQLSSMLVV